MTFASEDSKKEIKKDKNANPLLYSTTTPKIDKNKENAIKLYNTCTEENGTTLKKEDKGFEDCIAKKRANSNANSKSKTGSSNASEGAGFEIKKDF